MSSYEKINVVLNGISYQIDYTIEDLSEVSFRLTIWYKGESVSQKVPRYLLDPEQDVAAPHGLKLLEMILSE